MPKEPTHLMQGHYTAHESGAVPHGLTLVHGQWVAGLLSHSVCCCRRCRAQQCIILLQRRAHFPLNQCAHLHGKAVQSLRTGHQRARHLSTRVPESPTLLAACLLRALVVGIIVSCRQSIRAHENAPRHLQAVGQLSSCPAGQSLRAGRHIRQAAEVWAALTSLQRPLCLVLPYMLRSSAEQRAGRRFVTARPGQQGWAYQCYRPWQMSVI